MNTRRKFLRNSGIVASAVLAFDPLATLAGPAYFSSANDTANNTGSIILLHTNHHTAEDFSLTAAGTGTLAGRADNIILLNASESSAGLSQEQEAGKLRTMVQGGYGAALATNSDLSVTDAQQQYAPFVLSGTHAPAAGTAVQPLRIITKGNIKVGIIGTAALQNGAVYSVELLQEVNRLAKNLKEESGCKVVVCLSSLGYKTTAAIDDARLAKGSVNVDVIISANNAVRVKPSVILNSDGAEVLIDNAGNAATKVGKLEISFDGSGNKNHIAFGSQALSGIAASVALN
jgi:hypothetical protein